MKLAKYLHDARTLPADALRAWRLEGPAGVWSELAVRAVYPLIRFGRMLVFEQDLVDLQQLPAPAGVEIRRLDEVDLPALSAIATGRTIERFRRNLASGAACFVAWRGGRPIGCTWTWGRLPPGDLPISLPADAAYGWGLYVLPAERNVGVGSVLVNARLLHARELGFRRAWRAVKATNRPSLRTVEKAGAPGRRMVAELSYLKVLARYHARWRRRESSAAPATTREA